MAPEATYQLDDLHIQVTADTATLVYLDAFYDRCPVGGGAAHGLIVTSTLPPGAHAWHRTPFGIAIAQARAGDILIAEGRSADRAVTARKLVRSLWLQALLDRPATVLHASAFYRTGHVVVVAGDSHAGKTTLMLEAVWRHGWSFLANDRLLCWRAGEHLRLAPIPTVLRLRRSVIARHPGRLPAGGAGPPFPGDEPGAPSAEPGDPVFVPISAISPAKLPIVELTTQRVTVLLAAFRPDAHEDGRLNPLPATSQRTGATDAVEQLLVHVHHDWIAQLTAEALIPLPPLGEQRLVAASRNLMSALTERAAAYRLAHAGTFPDDLPPVAQVG